MSAAPSMQLRKAMRNRQLLRFKRRFENTKIQGYVQAVGVRFFLLALVSDRIRFDGYECFRIGDIRTLQPHPYAAFIEAAIRKRKEKLGRPPRIDVSDIGKLLSSAAKAFPLVTIHIEKIDPDVCFIGRVDGVRDGRLLMLDILPDASWDRATGEYHLADITRVGFGGAYEDALYLVGGEPPKLNLPKKRGPYKKKAAQ